MIRRLSSCLLAMQVSIAALAADNTARALHRKFDINGVQTGQPIEVARKKWPALECDKSCVMDNVNYLGAKGRFWASIENGKIDRLAFGFSPVLMGNERERVRADILKKYGPPARDLGLEGCDEWDVDGGYLAVCLIDEASHVFWSHESRKDVNASP